MTRGEGRHGARRRRGHRGLHRPLDRRRRASRRPRPSPTSHRSTRCRSPRSPGAEPPRPTRPSPPRARGSPSGDRCPPKERAEVLHRIADGVEARVPELAAVETRDNGSLLRSMRNSVMPRVARNFRFFADHLLTLGDDEGPRGVRRAFRVGPQRRHRGDHALERPADARYLARRPGAGGGQRRDPQAAGVGAAHCVDARRHRARRPACPTARSTCCRGSARRRAPRSPPIPGVDRIAFTGIVPTGKLVAQAAAANLTPG